MKLSDFQGKLLTGLKGSKYSAYIDQLYESLKTHYLKQQRDWYINERFIRGDHWIVFNKSTNTIQNIPSSEGEVRRTINKIRPQVRGIKNFIKRNQPRWQTAPAGPSDEQLTEAMKYNTILQNVYETRHFPSLLSDIVLNGLKTSVGILEAGLTKTNGKSYLDFWVDDTFDIFFDPYATDVQNGRFILKAVKKSTSSLKDNSKYTVDGELTPDNREGGSDYKDTLEKEKFNQSGTKIKDLESIIVKELWYKFEDKNGKLQIKKITSAGNQILSDETTPFHRFPLFLYNPDKLANSIYSDPWIKDLISPNKSLDKIASQIEAYIQRMLAGKYIIKRGVEVSTITDHGAEKMTYKGNTPPQLQVLPPLPSTPFQYVNNLEQWIEEFGGISAASLGRAPGSLQSGKGLEALQSADAANVSGPVENLEIMLSEVAEFILEMISETQIVSDTVTSGKNQVSFIGKVAGIDPNVDLIVEPRKVKVTIVPEISYTEDAKKELIFKLADAQIIDPQTLMEYLNISNISDIMERVKFQKDQQYQQQIAMQNAAHATNSNGPDDSATLADQENMKMAAGQKVSMTPQALWVPEHTKLHIAFINSNKDAYMQHQAEFDAHIRNEEQYKSNTPATPQVDQTIQQAPTNQPNPIPTQATVLPYQTSKPSIQ